MPPKSPVKQRNRKESRGPDDGLMSVNAPYVVVKVQMKKMSTLKLLQTNNQVQDPGETETMKNSQQHSSVLQKKCIFFHF